MSKAATIASLVRQAARSEEEFIEIAQGVLDEADHARTAEFFDRMNTPRSVGSETFLQPIQHFRITAEGVGDYDQEKAISDGIQKYLDRHERKIKWHAGHPSIEGAENVMLVMRCAISVTRLRLERLLLLLAQKDQLDPHEWAIARELMNRSYLSFRNFLDLTAGPWVEAMLASTPREEFTEKIGNFYEFIDTYIRELEDFRQKIEDRRAELTVVPEGFPPVKPPNYFGGDLLGRGPWKQFWTNLDSKAHTFREAVG